MFFGRQKEYYFTEGHGVRSSADANWLSYFDFSGVVPVNSGLDPQMKF